MEMPVAGGGVLLQLAEQRAHVRLTPKQQPAIDEAAPEHYELPVSSVAPDTTEARVAELERRPAVAEKVIPDKVL